MQIDRNGVRVHYEVAGSGPALLLTHGYIGSGHMFSRNVLALAEQSTVITWDMRGHGRSDSPTDPDDYSIALSVDDMVGILDAVGVGRAVIAGHSLGGFLSLSFYLAHPERVSGLALIDTGPGYRKAETRDGWNQMAEQHAVNFEASGLEALNGSYEAMASIHRDARGLIHTARAVLAQHDATVIESLSSIAVPTLVMVGENDTPFLDGCRYMVSKIPDAQLAIITGAGHVPNLAQPAEFERVLGQFLVSVSGS